MGSHDFSPSNKSMIRPLISAGFFIDVFNAKLVDDKIKLLYTQEMKTGIKLTGIRARKRSLEIEDYQHLDLQDIESEDGIKIFLFHTMLAELKPKEYKDMESSPKSLLPKKFIYYAGGHLHKTVPEKLREGNNTLKIDEKNNIIYPGCLFPTNFLELEKFKYGGFCIVSGEVDSNKNSLQVKWIPIEIKQVNSINIDCNNKYISQVQEIINNEISRNQFQDKIITIRFHGTLSSGKSYEIESDNIIHKLKKKGAYEVLINKSYLSSKEYGHIRVVVGKTNEEIENTLIHNHAQKIKIQNLSKVQIEKKIYILFEILGKEREEGTKVKEYENEIKQNFLKIFELETVDKEHIDDIQ